MGFRVLRADETHWRPSNQMGIPNANIGQQLGAGTVGARLWRLEPGQASTKHRHVSQHELYMVLEGTGRMRVEEELLTLTPLSAVLVEPETLRQVFNDTDAPALWLMFGAPVEGANSLEMSPETMAYVYPDGPRALPPELT